MITTGYIVRKIAHTHNDAVEYNLGKVMGVNEVAREGDEASALARIAWPENARVGKHIGEFPNDNQWVGTAHADKRGAFRRAAQMDYERLTQGGKPLAPGQEDDLLDNLVKDIVIKPGTWWDTTGPAFTAPKNVRIAREQGVPAVQNDNDFAKLKSGTRFVDPNGQIRVKP